MFNLSCISSLYQVRQFTVSQDEVPESPIVIAKADPRRWLLQIQYIHTTDIMIGCTPQFDGSNGIWLGSIPGKIIQFNARDHASLPMMEWKGLWSNPNLVYVTEVYLVE